MFLLRISNLNSIESEVDTRRRLFLGRLITKQKMFPTARHLVRTRTDSFFNVDLASLAFIPHIYETLNKYDLLHHFQLWFSESIFPCYASVNSKHQHRPLLLPRGRDLYLITFPGGRVFAYPYLHALHRQFRLSILA